MAKKKTGENSTSQERAKIEELEKIVIDLGKQGNSPSKIGIELKEKHGVQRIKVLGKSITKILKENNITPKTDLDFVNDKIKKLEEHHTKNRQDKRAQREIVKFVGLRKKLKKYNLRKNKD